MPSQAEVSPADAALCSRDRALVGLGTLLNASCAAQALGLTDLRQVYLRYKPGTSCSAGLIPLDGSLDAWAASTYPPTRWSEVRKRPKWTTGKIKALFIDDAHTVFVPIALERGLKHARRLSDDSKRARLLNRLGLDGCTLKVIRYKPGRRIVLRADGPAGPCAVIKLHSRQRDFRRALLGARLAAKYGGPALIGNVSKYRVIATDWINGHVLTASAQPNRFALAGAALARHHATVPTGELADWQATTPQDAAAAISTLLPDFADKADDLAQKLPRLPSDQIVALHGDFSADQVVCTQTGMTILDWDRAARGPAARDLGSALAQLELDAIRGLATKDAMAALLEGYGAVRPVPDHAAIRCHTAHALFALAVDGFRNRRADWDTEVRHVLDQVDQLCQSERPIPHSNPINGLQEALDLDHMRTLLGEDLAKTSLTRLKPGRRAMVRYDMTNGEVVLGKIRAKGADTHAPQIQKGLRAAGLDGTDGVGVPQMRGSFEKPAIWLQEAVEGRGLGDLLETGDVKDAMHRTGYALATLHDCPPQSRRRWTHEDELAVLEKALSLPHHQDLVSAARQRLAALPPVPDVGLHRDFYFDQVLVAPQTLWLVDLDLHARGDPAIDIGNFFAHLSELALRRGHGVDHFQTLNDCFLAGYNTRRTAPDGGRIKVMHWVSLARHIGIAARFPDRQHAISAIERECRRALMPTTTG